MPAPDERPRALDRVPTWLARTAALCACVLVIALAVWLASAFLVRLTVVVVPVLLALLLTAVLHPVAARLHHERLPEWVGPIVCVLAVLAILVGTFAVTGSRVAEQVPELVDQAAQLREQLNRSTGISLPPIPRPGASSDGSGSSGNGLDGAGAAATEALGIATEILVGLFLTLALAFLFLKDGERMWRWLLDRTGARVRDDVDAAGRAAWSTLATYVRGLTVVALFDALAIGAGLLALSVPLVLTLVVLQFLGSYIPTFGAFVAGAVAVGVALLSGGIVTAGLTLLLIVAVQQIGNDVIEPWIMGRTLPLHPAVVLVAVTSGAVLWGIAGAFLFVPLAASATAAVHAVRTTEAGAPATRG